MSDTIKKYEERENDLYWKSNSTSNKTTIYPGDIEVTIDKPKKDGYVQIVKNLQKTEQKNLEQNIRNE